MARQLKLGVIARCDDRGLGIQSWEVCRHLDPDRVLLIDTGPDGRFEKHPERYDQWDTTTVRWMPGFTLDEDQCRAWLDGLDVVYTAETTYDDRVPDWAAEAGCAVVVHANLEQLSPERAQRLNVVWWTATPWRLDLLPDGTRVVPMPVAAGPEHKPADRVRFLHVAGWPTAGDRNGTEIVADAASRMRSGAPVIIRGQHRAAGRRARRAPHVTIEAFNVADYWDLYRDADVLVMPRRFGGLCLPAQEAMSAGLAVVMSECSPNEIWPGPRVGTAINGTVRTPAGNLPLYDTDPAWLAAVLDDLAGDPDRVTELRQEATEWAQTHSWPALRDLWLTELESASSSPTGRRTSTAGQRSNG